MCWHSWLVLRKSCHLEYAGREINFRVVRPDGGWITAPFSSLLAAARTARKTFRTPATPSARDDRRFASPGRRFTETTVVLPRRRAVSLKLWSFYLGGVPSGRNDCHFFSAARRQPKTAVFLSQRRAVRPKRPLFSAKPLDFQDFPPNSNS